MLNSVKRLDHNGSGYDDDSGGEDPISAANEDKLHGLSDEDE